MEEKKIRVLQIVRHMNVGGAETFIMNLYRNIDREKVQFDFLVNGEGFFDEEIRSLGGKIFYMKYVTDVGQFKYKKILKEFFKEYPEYQIVHSHIDQVSGIILESAKESNVKVRIAHSHNTKNSNNVIEKIYKIYLQSKITKNATILLACGEKAAKWLYKGKSDEAIIVNNGVDIEKFRYSEENRNKIRKEFNVNDDIKILGHVGRFSEQKNHKFLIKIYNEYVKENPKSLLVMVGDGALKKEIEELVKKYSLENNVRFTGIRKDVNALYSAFDYLVFPSLYEGLSVALVEAQMSGLKIFASNTIDKNTDISGNINFISLDKTPQYWSKSILSDKNVRNSKNIKFELYDIKKIAKKMQDLYLNLGEN